MGKSILTERRWPYQVHAPITVAANGLITVPASSPQVTFFKVKQLVTLTLAGQESRDYRIRAVLSDTEIYLGPVDNPFRAIEKPIQFSGGTLSVMEQERNQMTWDVIGRAIYEEEPTVALRNVLVDWRGHFYDLDNPLPVQLSDGNISIGTVNAEVETQLSHIPNFPDPGDVPDSVQVGDGVEIIEVNPDGSINVVPTVEARKYKIINLPLPLANTSYTQILPANVRNFSAKIRDGKGILRVYETPPGTDYWTVSRGAYYDSKDFSNPALSITVQASVPGCVLEIICWIKGP